jgi:hypothetical protein
MSHAIITGKAAITSATTTGVMIVIVAIVEIMPVAIVLIIMAVMLADIVMVIMADMQTGAIMVIIAITGSIVTTLAMAHTITGTIPACISAVCM